MSNETAQQLYLAEQITGACLNDQSIAPTIGAIIRGRMFVDSEIGKIFDFVCSHPDLQNPEATVLKMLANGVIDRVKGIPTVFRLIKDCVTWDLAITRQNAEEVKRYFQHAGKVSPIFCLLDLESQYPDELPPIIDGLLRQREVMNCIAATKVGKSWLILGMLMSIATGRHWLGRAAASGRVLLIDNELRKETIAKRIRTVATSMGIELSALNGRLDVLPLRGRLMDIGDIRKLLGEDRSYSLIAIDAFYRVLPSGVSENDNAQMAGIYNGIDAMASNTGAAIVLIHHASKGDQSGKTTTDVGSGAGSISRAADTHLILRPHAVEGHAVLDAACRSFQPNPPSSLRWEYPLWHSCGLPPELMQSRPGARALKSKAKMPLASSLAFEPYNELEGFEDD